MNRTQLTHILRAAARIADEPDIVVIGSQSVLGTYTEDELPARAVASMEADLTLFDDDDNEKSDQVDGQRSGEYADGSRVVSSNSVPGVNRVTDAEPDMPPLSEFRRAREASRAAWIGTTSPPVASASRAGTISAVLATSSTCLTWEQWSG